MALTLITPATVWPVALEEQVARCRAEGLTEREGEIQALIEAATGHLEELLGLSIAEQGWRLVLDEFLDCIELPMGPVIAVSAIEWVDDAGAEHTVDSAVYALDLVSPVARLQLREGQTWPEVTAPLNGVRITYSAGMPAPKTSLREAIKMLAANWYDSPDNAGKMPEAVWALISPFRRIRI